MSLFGDEPEDNSGDNSGDLGQGMASPFGGPETNMLLPPREQLLCLGHGKEEQHMLSAVEHNIVPHGLMFTGIKGIGKATFAHRFAKFLLAHDKGDGFGANAGGLDDGGGLFGDEELPQSAFPYHDLSTDPNQMDVRLYTNKSHPDCMTVERPYDEAKNRYKDAIDVDSVRKIEPFLRMTASDGGWRIVIIDDADTMNRNSQNALLKILEEPPKKTLIILIAHQPGRLIPTIHSRTQKLDFKPLSSAHMQDLLNRTEMPPSTLQMQDLIAMSGGSIGRAIELWEEGGLEALETTLSLLAGYPSLSWANVHKLSDGLAKLGQDQAYKMCLSTLSQALRSIVVSKARGIALPDYIATSDAMQSLAAKLDLRSAISLADDMDAHIAASVRGNLDKKQTILHAIGLIAA